MITNDARTIREIKSRTAMANAAFYREKTLLLKFKEETITVLYIEHSVI
jgi:hypothetical protein